MVDASEVPLRLLSTLAEAEGFLMGMGAWEAAAHVAVSAAAVAAVAAAAASVPVSHHPVENLS